MRIVKIGDPIGTLIGCTPARRLEFTKAERATLRKAAEIADAARDLWRKSVDYDVECEGMDTELAMIAIAVDEVVNGIEIEAPG